MSIERRALSWHMRVVAIYFVIAAFWTWGFSCWTLISGRSPFASNVPLYFVATVLTLLCLASAITIYRRNKLAIPIIVAIPLVQWLAFVLLYQNLLPASDFSSGLDYLRHLPSVLKMDIVLYGALAVYALFLWKRGELS